MLGNVTTALEPCIYLTHRLAAIRDKVVAGSGPPVNPEHYLEGDRGFALQAAYTALGITRQDQRGASFLHQTISAI